MELGSSIFVMAIGIGIMVLAHILNKSSEEAHKKRFTAKESFDKQSKSWNTHFENFLIEKFTEPCPACHKKTCLAEYEEINVSIEDEDSEGRKTDEYYIDTDKKSTYFRYCMDCKQVYTTPKPLIEKTRHSFKDSKIVHFSDRPSTASVPNHFSGTHSVQYTVHKLAEENFYQHGGYERWGYQPLNDHRAYLRSSDNTSKVEGFSTGLGCLGAFVLAVGVLLLFLILTGLIGFL